MLMKLADRILRILQARVASGGPSSGRLRRAARERLTSVCSSTEPAESSPLWRRRLTRRGRWPWFAAAWWGLVIPRRARSFSSVVG